MKTGMQEQFNIISWNSVSVSNVKIEYTTNNGTDWNLVVNNYTNSGSYLWTVPTINSSTCLIRISDAQNADITNTGSAFSIFIYPTTISAVTSISFGSISDVSNYRMISLPGLSNKKVSDLLSGEHPYDWNAYWDNGQSTGYKVQYDGSSTFNFKPGIAFWILSKNPFSISQDVNNVPLYDDNSYKIDIHNGWNIISNPYDKKVSWLQVQQINNLPSNAIIYLWEGTFSQPAEMEKYKGYYFNNIYGKDSLIIPYDPYALGKKLSKENMFHKSEMELTLSLSYKDEIKSYIKLGIDSSASMDFDTLDYFAPPGDFEKYSIKLVNDKLGVRDKYLFIENRPGVDEGQIFDLEIKSLPNEKIEIDIDGLKNFSDYQIYLLDCRMNRLKDIKNLSTLPLSLQHQYNTYKLLIGSENFIENVKQDLVPQQYYLYQNYPNPANPNTFIQYDLSQNTHVRLKIYDILGNEVETLVNAEQKSGRYEVLFSADRYASGVYLYRLETDSFTAVKKMVLLK